ncbi:unnamed protein product [Discula destructiva]
MSTTARVSTPAHDAEARPRNRRLGTAADGTGTSASRSTSLLATSRNQSPHNGGSPIPTTRLAAPSSRSSSRPAVGSYLGDSSTSTSAGKGWLDTSWSAGWSSVQDLASSILGADPQRGRGPRQPMLRTSSGTFRNNVPNAWGPEPPSDTRPGIDDVAAGTLADRDAAFKARKTASVLESHEGVNGGLDVTGRFKRRNSEEGSQVHAAANPEIEDQLVYIHHVQANDTYAGIILKYRCQEDCFRKANGLWSRDNIQVRKWLALPVDACEVRGRPCDPSSFYSKDVDHLAPTPIATTPAASSPLRVSSTSNPDDDFFASPNGKAPEKTTIEEEKPWTHVRWVKLDHCQAPVEIGRVSRKAMGYFPPRRKKSVRTISSLSTPRGSFDVPSITLDSDVLDSPGGSSRRQSMLASRPSLPATYASSAPTPSRSRVGSGNDDIRPAWMRRPGGVGSLSRTVRAPGPEKDYFNTWAKKHLPSLNIDTLPSMAIMGSETARFGFNEEGAAIVESPFEDGRDMASANQHGTGLDKAAATIETWLRGAWAKRPNTPILGPNRLRGVDGDLIELEDTNSEDGRMGGLLDQGDSSLLNSNLGFSSRSDCDTSLLRGRIPVQGLSRDKKAD